MVFSRVSKFIRGGTSIIMPTTRFLLISFITLLFCFNTASGKSPVWKISKNDNYFFLAGTIHLLSEGDYPLPQAFETAFSSADELFFETDIESMKSPENQIKLIPVFMFSDSRTLLSELSPTVYSQLESFLAVRKIPIETFNKFTPAGVSLTLTIIELQRLGVVDAAGASNGVDEYYFKRGVAADKKVGALESIDDQLSFLQKMNEEDSDQIIKSSLRDLAKMESVWKQMLTAWRVGDLTALEELGVKPMQEFPRLFQLLLVQRNNNWLKKIKPMMDTPEIEFILVGAMHMVGNDGLLQQLRLGGYQVEQLN